ncbi:hypothetical protein WUBG_10819 [Wuchereria bancrofti]|uniref:Uncharacterized protein n=1 Tax=Wuchereria bancrofti TaxID=6293 RepID=J9ESN3_WUCBA|nr:hypothetical protein WUBG_10819 [Wuchereria bancrofti]
MTSLNDVLAVRANQRCFHKRTSQKSLHIQCDRGENKHWALQDKNIRGKWKMKRDSSLMKKKWDNHINVHGLVSYFQQKAVAAHTNNSNMWNNKRTSTYYKNA